MATSCQPARARAKAAATPDRPPPKMTTEGFPICFPLVPGRPRCLRLVEPSRSNAAARYNRRDSKSEHGRGNSTCERTGMIEGLNRPPGAKRGLVGVTSRARRRRLEGWAIVIVIGLAALLRIALLDRNGLWADEIFSLAMATGHSLEHPAADADPGLGDFVEMPNALPVQFYRRYLEHEETPAELARIIRAVRLSHTSPPLYSLLLSFWTRVLGTSDAGLRLFSVLWALSTFPGLVYLARRLGGRPAVLPVCVLFAASPVALFYSIEGRMYSLVWFLAATLAA